MWGETFPTMGCFRFDPQRYPTCPGCYLMSDGDGACLYVGKARNLRRRLGSYFQRAPRENRLAALVAEVAAVEVILVSTETESLILENNLIKRLRPRYNRALMREDTGYSYILLTGERFPRLVMYRKNWANRDLGDLGDPREQRRFGPYVSSRFRDTLLDFVTEHFQIRTCHPLPNKVCLRYHLGWCGGICEGRVSPEEYQQSVHDAVAFLSHGDAGVLAQMKREMAECADRLEFERAGRIRQRIQALEAALDRQVVETAVAYDQDVIYFGPRQALLSQVEHGMLCGIELFDLDLSHGYREACRSLLMSQYTPAAAQPRVPRELILNAIDSPPEIAKALAEATGHPIRITLPQRGVKAQLLALCRQNHDYRAALDAP